MSKHIQNIIKKTILFVLSISLIIFIFSFLTELIFTKLITKNIISIFIYFSIASILFIPTPLDFIYYNFLNDNISGLFLATLFGLLVGQCINYILGKYLEKLIDPYINKKTKKWVEEKLYKYESYAIFIFNLFPLPYTLLNFIAGLTKFKFTKWLSIVSIAFTIKLILITLIKFYI